MNDDICVHYKCLTIVAIGGGDKSPGADCRRVQMDRYYYYY